MHSDLKPDVERTWRYVQACTTHDAACFLHTRWKGPSYHSRKRCACSCQTGGCVTLEVRDLFVFPDETLSRLLEALRLKEMKEYEAFMGLLESIREAPRVKALRIPEDILSQSPVLFRTSISLSGVSAAGTAFLIDERRRLQGRAQQERHRTRLRELRAARLLAKAKDTNSKAKRGGAEPASNKQRNPDKPEASVGGDATGRSSRFKNFGRIKVGNAANTRDRSNKENAGPRVAAEELLPIEACAAGTIQCLDEIVDLDAAMFETSRGRTESDGCRFFFDDLDLFIEEEDEEDEEKKEDEERVSTGTLDVQQARNHMDHIGESDLFVVDEEEEEEEESRLVIVEGAPAAAASSAAAFRGHPHTQAHSYRYGPERTLHLSEPEEGRAVKDFDRIVELIKSGQLQPGAPLKVIRRQDCKAPATEQSNVVKPREQEATSSARRKRKRREQKCTES